MAKFLYKLGTFIAQKKWLAVFAWIILIAVIVLPLTLNAPKFDDDIQMNGLKSLDTNEKINKEFHQDSEKASMRIVFHSQSENGINDKDTKKDIEKTLDDIKQDDDDILNVSNPYESKQINDDKDTAIADINYVVSQTSLKDSSKNNIMHELNKLEDDHNLQIETTEGTSSDVDIGGMSEVIGVIVAFVILLITFGSLIAAGMPIISAVIGLGSSIGLIGLLTYVFDIPNVTLTLAVMIGLAVGIDYSLFILFRYKEVSKTEKDPIKAIGMAVGTAGSAVIFAGITVIIAVCGLSLVGIEFLAVMGYASAISVLFAVLAALTLLPAFISIFHKHIKIKNKKNTDNKGYDTPWSNFVVGKPVIAVILSLVVLGLAIIPVAQMRLGMPDDGMKPADSSAYKANELVSKEFGEGYNGQIVMLINTKDNGSENTIKRNLDNVRDDLEDLDSVDKVSSPQLTNNNNYALLAITPEEGPNAVSTNDLVYDLRDYDDQAQDKYDFNTEISGQSVINIDMSKKLNDAIPVFAGVIVALAFVLLLFVFRSILVPLKAVLGFVLSLMATLGFTTFVMQEGFLSGLFGIDATGPILAFLPVITIGLLFGLAIDYELFLMSRVHEEFSKTGDNAHSIKVGIKQSGPVIVAAALIMFSVFIAFVFQDDVTIKSMGISLAFGVLFDAFIVRMTLIPALTKLFGNASWYMPKWLDRLLPKIDVEGHALQEGSEEDTHNSTYNFGVDPNNQNVEQRTTNLFKDLSNDSLDQMILFNALMLYAKEYNPSVYDKYINQEDLKEDNQEDLNDDNNE
ncbi:MMPL family transporter [Mammaliicoccus lentus]|uniref:MMPL family transporter n=1 Tax=Mammaliicoccus lentus TaxID=42858 RepID=UPI0011C7957A|nr:MMPL family transporter [Mammaliicoccus lentus]